MWYFFSRNKFANKRAVDPTSLPISPVSETATSNKSTGDDRQDLHAKSSCPRPDVDCVLTKPYAIDGAEECAHEGYSESAAESPLKEAPKPCGRSLDLFILSTCPQDLKDLFAHVQGEQHSTDWQRAEKLRVNDKKVGPSWMWWLCYYGLPHCPNLRVLE